MVKYRCKVHVQFIHQKSKYLSIQLPDKKFIRGDKDASASWPGLIDDVCIYDRVLSESEIAELTSGVLAVEADGKLTTTWADLKQKRD